MRGKREGENRKRTALLNINSNCFIVATAGWNIVTVHDSAFFV